jgi:site-specific DNA recombinase
MLKQVERWVAERHSPPHGGEGDAIALREELTRLKRQEDRVTKAYTEGIFTITKLREFIDPLKAKIAALEGKLASAGAMQEGQKPASPPQPQEIAAFVEKAEAALQNLNFEQKRAIVVNVIDKVVAGREVVEVYGYIPIADHVELCSTDRDAANTTRHGRDNRSGKSVPFELVIPLPPPLRRGIDYGFLPGANVSKKGRGTRAGT